MQGSTWSKIATGIALAAAFLGVAGTIAQANANRYEIDAAVMRRLNESLNKQQPNNKQASDKALITECLITCSEHNLIYLEGDNLI